MSERFLTLIVHFVTHAIGFGGYAGIVALMGIESACVPLPSEIIMPFAGFLVSSGRFGGGNSWAGLAWVATAGAVGCNVGSVVGYWIGASGGRLLVERYGRWVLMSRRDLDWITKFFLKYGVITVLLSRMLPVARTFIAFPAGIARMPQLRFHVYTFLGSWPWCLALAYVGMRLRDKWHTDPRFHEVFHRFHLAVELGLIALAVWFVWEHVRRSRQAESA